MKWFACYITLNGGEYIWYSIKSIYDFIKESGGKIIIIEGSTDYAKAVNEEGLSLDDTEHIINDFIKDSPEDFIIYKRLGKVKDKTVLRQAYIDALDKLPDGQRPDHERDMVLVVDDDELYKKDDLDRLNEYLERHHQVMHVFNPQRWFWKDFNHVADSDEYGCMEQIAKGKRADRLFFDMIGTRVRQGQYHERIFRWQDGMHYPSHATISDKEGRQIYIDDEYRKRRIVFPGCPRYHYGYLTETKRMWERFRYYELRDKARISSNPLNVWLDNYGGFLLKGAPLNTVTMVKPYFGDHPEIIKEHPYWKLGKCPMALDAENLKKEYGDDAFEKIQQEVIGVKEPINKEVKQQEWYDKKKCLELVEKGKKLAESVEELPKVAYCFMTLNRSDELKTAVGRVKDYVDKIVAVDGGSVDDSIEFLQNIEKCDIVRRTWDDKFDVQRNQYLNHVLEKYPDHWVLVSDTDEWYCKEFMENLKYILLACEEEGYNRLGIMCWFKMVAGEDSPKAFEKPPEFKSEEQGGIKKTFFKKLAFKAQDGMNYVKSPHEGLFGTWNILNLGNKDWYFEHVKTRKAEVERGARNYFIAGPGMRKPKEWEKFRKLTEKVGWNIWADMNAAMIKGSMPEFIYEWIWSRRDWVIDEGPSSEQREFWIYFYEFLHPEMLEDHKKMFEKFVLNHEQQRKLIEEG